jgi:hypothetical protein
MSDEQTTCSACGRTILTLTAQENGGRCVPCARGTRERIEDGRRLYYEDKAFRQSPVWLFWERLVQAEFEALTHNEQIYFAVNCLRGEVINGGFHQFFFNSSGLLYPLAEEGLRLLGARQTLPILEAAKRAIFREDTVTRDAQARNLQLTLEDEALSSTLDQLNRRFWDDPDGLWELLQDFGVAQGFYPQRWRPS